MLCKFARTCVGLVTRFECTTRPKPVKSGKPVYQNLSHLPKRLEEDKRDHLLRTEGSFRQNVQMQATVIDIEKLSHSVRGLKLVAPLPESVIFKAGQWVDMVIPNVDTVGGFSVCSSPHIFKDRGHLELAIKYSDHPPAKWIHEQCHVGSTVSIKFGGDFFYEPTKQGSENILLIAGGVGINPIYSILQERCKPCSGNQSKFLKATKLLYSAKTKEELIFLVRTIKNFTGAHHHAPYFTQTNIQHICKDSPAAKYEFFVTQGHVECVNQEDENITNGRIGLPNLQDSLDEFNQLPTCFICGPPNFIDNMVDSLKALGVPSHKIKFEKWW